MNPLNTYLDHTLLKADAKPEDILHVIEEAKQYKTASVCVNTCYASLVSEHLTGSGVKTCVVVGFPLGAMSTAAKSVEAAIAVRDGAEEIDMVINIGSAKAGNWTAVQADIAAVVNASKPAIVKVILETCLLTDAEKVQACLAAKAAGAAFVKTSTGFSTGGATLADVALMRKTVGPDMGVKASGGVRTREQAEAMISAGATRIGCSSTKKIMDA
jgi:deoxyribose-phosphate aldolase